MPGQVEQANATVAGAGDLAGFIESLYYQGPLGLFLAAFISNLIPGFPAVYLALVATYAALVDNVYANIAALVLAGVGAGLGKVLVFLVSNYLGSKSRSIQRRREQAKWILGRAGKGVFLTVFLFAALPLPDDLLYIPLGIAGYRLVPFVVAVVLGKIVMTGIAVFLGKAYRGVLDKFMGGGTTPVSLEVLIAGALVGSIVLSYVVLAMDWKKLYDVYRSKGVIHALLAFIVEFFYTLFKPLIALFNIIARTFAGR